MTAIRNGVSNDAGKSSSVFLKTFFSFLLTFVLMLLCWLVLSGMFDPLLLVLAVISSFLVSYY